mmetsp:Transcript_40733/g.98338  ORF Transcript_40733/g.98338 Transcript_40733/m.98338 type:complete len:294 (-) Transcript_40733:298-1179(-)
MVLGPQPIETLHLVPKQTAPPEVGRLGLQNACAVALRGWALAVLFSHVSLSVGSETVNMCRIALEEAPHLPCGVIVPQAPPLDEQLPALLVHHPVHLGPILADPLESVLILRVVLLSLLLLLLAPRGARVPAAAGAGAGLDAALALKVGKLTLSNVHQHAPRKVLRPPVAAIEPFDLELSAPSVRDPRPQDALHHASGCKGCHSTLDELAHPVFDHFGDVGVLEPAFDVLNVDLILGCTDSRERFEVGLGEVWQPGVQLLNRERGLGKRHKELLRPLHLGLALSRPFLPLHSV